MTRSVLRVSVVLLLRAPAASTADAQRMAPGPGDVNARPRFGAHAGYNVDVDHWLAGAQAVLPIGAIVDLYPNLDYFRLGGSSAWGLNLDLRAQSPARSLSWYLGGRVLLPQHDQRRELQQHGD